MAVDWSQSLKGSAKVSEITCLVDLENEGNAMQHCVVTYHGFCAYGSYRVFSLNMNNERATLGLSRMPNKAIFQHDQIRGLSNDAVSNDMVKLGRRVLSIVNKRIGV
ncbi:PcfJ domain-containing protein [Serratia sp. J2]|uniref:PcfJ domain-containing protein n=1 Tax=Serratia sp. J2 TaxID=3386551 RepID=UPI0039170641